MKKFIISIIAALLLPAVSMLAADAAETITRQYKFNKPFNAIKTYAGVTLKYTVMPADYQPTARLVVEKAAADDSVELTVSNGELVFGFAGANKNTYNLNVDSLKDLFKLIRGACKSNGKRKATLYLSAPAVSKITASSASDVEVSGNYSINTDIFLKASSGADVEIQSLRCEKLDVETSSGADVEIKNLVADRIYADASSGSDIDLKNIVVAGRVTASSSSGADIDFQGKAGTAKLTASSGSDIDGRKLIVNTAEIKASSGASVNITAPGGAEVHKSSGGSAKAYRAL